MNAEENIRLQKMATEGGTLQQLTQGGKFRPVLDFELGVKRAKCVALIIRAGSVKGTGFLLPGNWLLTNHHVLPDRGVVADSGTTAHFNFQIGEDGRLPAPAQFHFEPDSFQTSPSQGGDDWTAVRLLPNEKGDAARQFGFIPIEEVESESGDAIHIIQHPHGEPKVFASGHVTHVPEGRMYYNVDTLEGSSGAPVFNSVWKVVALHHAAADRDPDTGEWKPLNRGIQIGTVIKGLKTAGLWPLSPPKRAIAHESGPMSPASDWYVRREPEDEILDFFRNHGVSASLRGGARMGKSSIATRLSSALAMDGWHILRLDLRDDFSSDDFANGHTFLRKLAEHVICSLRAASSSLRVFETEKSGSAFRDFMDEVRLEKKENRLLIVLDHADHLAGQPGCSVAVGGLRSCHSGQCELGAQGWVHFLLIHTLTPRQAGPAGSIFKVAESFPVTDFGLQELERLIARYDLRGIDAGNLLRVLGGHPYLTRLALNAIAANKCVMDDIVEFTLPMIRLFRPHLEEVSWQMGPMAIAGFHRLAAGSPLGSMDEFEALLLAGVVGDFPWREAQFRCELYQKVLGKYLP